MSNYLYIGIGAKSHYFTLREIAPSVIGNNGIQDIYWQNLSQNADVAIEKARLIAANLGLELKANRQSLSDQLDAIKRASAEELAEHIRKEEENDKATERFKEEQIAIRIESITSGVYPFGKYRGCEFRQADVGYINWVINNTESEDIVIKTLAEAVNAACSDLILPVANQNLIGNVGDKITANVTVVRTSGYDSNFGYVNVVTMVTDSGECLVTKSKFYKKVGSKLTITAKVKDHSEYNGQQQTIIFYVKEI